jgi:hypothetical protein
MKGIVLILVLVGLSLAACTMADLEKWAPKEDNALARHFIESVRVGDYAGAQSMLGPSIQGQIVDAPLRTVHGLFDKGKPLEVELIGFTVTRSSKEAVSDDLSYQIHFPNAWIAGDVYIQKQKVLGFHFRPIAESFQALNRFTFTGKSPLHYFFLACCMVVPCFILYALIVCIRTPLRRKWLWIPFILFALVEFRLNWTTGKWDVQPLSISLLGSGAFASGPYAPWILDFGLPVGAAIFLLRRKRLDLRLKPPVQSSPENNPS